MRFQQTHCFNAARRRFQNLPPLQQQQQQPSLLKSVRQPRPTTTTTTTTVPVVVVLLFLIVLIVVVEMTDPSSVVFVVLATTSCTNRPVAAQQWSFSSRNRQQRAVVVVVPQPFRMNQNSNNNAIQQQQRNVPTLQEIIYTDVTKRTRIVKTAKVLSSLLRVHRGGGDTGGDPTTVSNDDDDDDDSSTVHTEDAVVNTLHQPQQPSHHMSHPVTLQIQTNTGSKLIDPMIELPFVHPNKRTILSIKQSIQRQLSSSSSGGSSSKPPLSTIRLVYQGQVLTDDDVLLADVLDEDDDDDDDDYDDSSDDTEQLQHIQMYIDMIPPVVVDAKNAMDWESTLDDITTSQLLYAYATNEAALYYNTIQQMELQRRRRPNASSGASITGSSSSMDQQTLPDENVKGEERNSNKRSGTFISDQIRERAEQIKTDLETTLLRTTAQSRKLLSETETPNEQLARTQLELVNNQGVEIRGERIRRVGVSGIRGNFVRKLQHELNIEDWYTTMKHCALFLFFGYFGGRTVTSRTLLLLGAPLMIVLQTRWMKLHVRQLLFTALYHPPSILLSLLPAPQQAILSLNIKDSMKRIYGATENTVQIGMEGGEEYEDTNDDAPIVVETILTSKRFTRKAMDDDIDDDDDDDEAVEEEEDDDDEY